VGRGKDASFDCSDTRQLFLDLTNRINFYCLGLIDSGQVEFYGDDTSDKVMMRVY